MKKILVLFFIIAIISPVMAQEMTKIKEQPKKTAPSVFYFGDNAKMHGKSISIKEWKEMPEAMKQKFVEEYLTYEQKTFDDKKAVIRIIESFGGENCKGDCLDAPLYPLIDEYIRVVSPQKDNAQKQ